MMEEVKERNKLSNLKIVSMKRALILFWHGLTGILAGMANWFTVILGMRDDSRYGRFIRRVVGTCFSLIMIMMSSAVIYSVGKAFYEELPRDVRYGDDDYFPQYISRNVTYFCKPDWGEDGYIRTRDGEKTITGIKWTAKPLGLDSLICYSDGEKRGYFNMFTGKPVIEPRYDHAWIFSDGLASVDDNGWIKFIDASGKVVIDPQIPYIPGTDGYVFHNNRCVVHNDRRDRFGIIDKHGKWVLKPEYFSIQVKDSLWIIDNGRGQSVVDANKETVVPFVAGQLTVGENYICGTMSDHSLRRYSLQGELVDDFYINDVSSMTYNTDELRYISTKTYDEDGNVTGETEDAEPTSVQQTARCRRYEAEYGWYGLMAPDGRILSPPSYSSITAVDYDMYLCKDADEGGILLNGKGERIR